MPRFVLLLHETPSGYLRPTHYDLMLERGDSLLTWAIDCVPEVDQAVEAQRLPDHRLDYLTYEGEVAGNRGRVSRIDAGPCDIERESPDEVVAIVAGKSLVGRLCFQLINDRDERWRVSLASR